MKCPLLAIAEMGVPRQGKGPDIDCLKEECAWWSASEQQCAAMIVAANLAGLVAIGDQLLDKMPTEKQFRK